MKELIRENMGMIITLLVVFVSGMGIGGAITDVINDWNPKSKNKPKD